MIWTIQHLNLDLPAKEMNDQLHIIKDIFSFTETKTRTINYYIESVN